MLYLKADVGMRGVERIDFCRSGYSGSFKQATGLRNIFSSCTSFGEDVGGADGIGAVSAAPWGSASILLISYAFIRMLGAKGLTQASRVAILNANYMKARLEPHFPVLYANDHGRVAHEMILDLRAFKQLCGITEEDVAKRLMDFGFHAPTVSWPVPGTMMIEPTESESKQELDRFCDALIEIRSEIQDLVDGKADRADNPLKNAPHPVEELICQQWPHGYTREEAAYPLDFVRANKFWPATARIDNPHGDRSLLCACQHAPSAQTPPTSETPSEPTKLVEH